MNKFVKRLLVLLGLVVVIMLIPATIKIVRPPQPLVLERGEWREGDDDSLPPTSTFCTEESGIVPPKWKQHGDLNFENPLCYSGVEGHYVGACPCNVLNVGIVPTEKSPWVSEYSAVVTVTPIVVPTPTKPPLERVYSYVPVNVYGDNVDLLQGLNIRCEPTLYDDCILGFAVPYCDYISEYDRGWRDCNKKKDSVVIHSIMYLKGDLFHPQDSGWWGSWYSGWMAICLDRDKDREQPCYVDWTPPME
jgi:hypothetical protein